jgi:hypothetical protein
MSKIACALVGGKVVEELADRGPQRGDGARGRFAQQRFELGEERLDRIEIGRVGPAPAQAGGGRKSRTAPAAAMA